MPRSLQYDRQLFGVTAGLCLAGVLMVFSASSVMVLRAPGAAILPQSALSGSGYAVLLRQLLWLIVGGTGMVALMNVDYRKLREPKIVFTALAVITLALLSVFLLDRSHATHRWFRIGPASFQPSELAKLVVILYLAWFLDSRKPSLGFCWRDLKEGVLPALGPVLLMALLVLAEPDMGTSAMLMLVAIAMLLAAGLSCRYFLLAAAAIPPAFWILVMRVAYRRERVLAFLHPQSNAHGAGFQLMQSLIAVGPGGFTGAGLMDGRQKLAFLPDASTDFIYAVLGEEMGFIGAALLLALFAWFAWRGLRTALRAPGDFGRYLALGVTVLVTGQALINMSVVLGMVPTKGIPLPFISYGGSSLVAMLLAAGLLLNLSQYAD